SPWNTRFPLPYSCKRVNVGLVTSSSGAAFSPATMPLVRVVLPLPSSPESSTSTGARRRAANSRPQAMVSSAEWVITSSATLLQLLEEFAPGKGDGVGHFTGQNAGGVALLREKLRGQAVEIYS